MKVKFYLIILSFCCTVLHAQTSGDNEIRYVVDTIAAPNCYQSGDGAILLDEVWIPGTIDRYEWSDGSTMEDLIYVNGGTYQLTIYNTDGVAFTTEEFFIPEPDSLYISAFVSAPTANDKDDGFLDLTFQGGTAPYELTMIFNQDTSIITSDSVYTVEQVDTGMYVFYVMDARGCTDTAMYTLSARSCALLVTAIIEPAECSGVPSGRIELLVENAVEPYKIEWENRQGNQPVQANLDAGKYKFKVSDRRRCMVEDSIEIIYEDRIPPRAVLRNNLLLYLDEEGKAEITPNHILIGARDDCHNNLTFQFDKNTFTCHDVGTSEVNFYVIDGVGNAALYPVQVEIRDTASVELIYQDTVYTALCNGIAQYEQPKVRGSCSFLSSGGVIKATTREITAPGVYEDRYYYIENSGDTLWAKVTIFVSDARVRSFLIVTEPQCNKGDDGSIAVALRNASEPVSYRWDNGSTDDYVFGIFSQKEYSVEVTEGHGCVFQLSAFIEGPDSISVTLQQIIENEEEGTIDIIPNITGGSLPLSYAWILDGQVISESRNLHNVADGKRYVLRVTDAQGCIGSPLVVDRLMTSSSEEPDAQEVKVFPNPLTGDILHLSLGSGFFNYNKAQLINSKSQIVRNEKIANEMIQIQMQQLPAGMYILRIYHTDGRIINRKIIKL